MTYSERPKLCLIEECENPANIPGSARGICRSHYRRWQTYGDVNEPVRRVYKWTSTCNVASCDRKARSLGMCQKHYANLRRTGNPMGLQRQPQACPEDSCEERAHGKGMCQRHYGIARRAPAREAARQRRLEREEKRVKECEWCGATFRGVRTSTLGRFCSYSCKNQSQECKETVPCTQCGTQVARKPSAIDRYETGMTFCGKPCWHEWRNRNRTAIRFGGTIPVRARKVYGTSCVICGESRAVEYAHKVAARHGGTVHPTNIYVLCPTHHTILDNHPERLTDDEISKLKTVAETWSQTPGSTDNDASPPFEPELSA